MDEKAKKTLKILEEMTREETREPRRKYGELSRATKIKRITRDSHVERTKNTGNH